MKVLVVGSGGREDALVWALARSPRVADVVCAPGNAGTARRARNAPVEAGDVDGLVALAREERVGLVVVGPEVPLCAGLVDRLREHGIPAFGPHAAAARLEGSKVFAKRFMERHGIPTAGFRVFDDAEAADRYLAGSEARYPLVVKADGLAAGKGVVIAADAAAAREAARQMLVEGRFGEAGSTVLIEDCLVGREASFFVLADGDDWTELATCQDYKRARDGDRGENTGGMGTYSPSAFLDAAKREELVERIVRPTLSGLVADGEPYRGVLYVGVMLTPGGPRVLEYNARFGDPETQVLMPRLDGDWFELLHACATGTLASRKPRFKPEAAVCVVMAAGGYPGAYARGEEIHGIEDAEALSGVHVFHAGTTTDAAGRITTAGGRVLGVTALGADLAAARGRAYQAVDRIRWNEEHHRLDIASDALEGATT